ncbi:MULTISPECIES: hypothetical protein [Sphingobacterium]|uniref:Ubiquinone biosynthesis protein COQ4 n=1 Tax=Sphingobacterium tenebrionis TaxID=3111775 RepID=A0ABU8I7K0_9SPHI|nr:hypothetical protein [Sphingobacterium sp. CZ-2]QBR12089.1 hypothetical protein E3D81_07895 [Sphingobacterium sp. CZ-2]
MLWLYTHSSRIYAQIFKANKTPWGIKKEEFLNYPEGSIGYQLGVFYQEKGFDVMPTLENHDVFHVLTGTGIDIQDEIAMQYLLFGNGKVSLYLLGMLFVGTFVFPEHFRYYRESYQKGKFYGRFYDVEFKEMLHFNLIGYRSVIARRYEEAILPHVMVSGVEPSVRR